MKKFIPKFLSEANNIRVNVTHVYIHKNAWDILGNPQRIDIYYDEVKKAIQVKSSETGLLYVKGNRQVNCQLSKIMPMGNYIYSKEAEAFIFCD